MPMEPNDAGARSAPESLSEKHPTAASRAAPLLRRARRAVLSGQKGRFRLLAVALLASASPALPRDGVFPTGSETWLHVAALILLPALVFSNSLSGEYHLDDVYRVARNPEIERVAPVWRHFADPRTSATLPSLVQYRPLLPLSLSLNRAASERLGIEPRVGFHLGNLALHVAGALLLYALFRELLAHWSRMALGPKQRARLALAAALAFAVHPVAGVSVNYVCGRDLLLMLAFLAAALLVHVRWRRLGGGGWRLPLFALLLACSLLSKTNSLVAPLLILVFEVTCGGEKPWSPRAWLRALPAAAVAGGFVLFTRYGLGFSDAAQLLIERQHALEYPLTELRLHLAYYLRNVLWPFFLRAEAQIEPATGVFEPGVLAGFALVVCSLVAGLYLRRRAPLAAFCIGAYWTLFLLTSSVLPLRRFVTDYRQVPSLAFLCLLLALIVFRFLRGGTRFLVVSLALAWCAATSVYVNRHWRTEESFWAQSVRHGGSALAHVNYGLSVRARDPRLAEEHFLKALELYPQHVYGHINLGLLYIDEGRDAARRAQGLELVRRALAIWPDQALTHYWLGVAYQRLGRAGEGALEIARAAELDRRNEEYEARARALVPALYEAAREAQLAGDIGGSLPYLERLHALQPSCADSLFLEGHALQKAGRLEQAVERYRRFLADEEGHWQAHFNLAHALMERGDHAGAVAHFERTLELEPDYREAHRHLASCYEALGDAALRAEHERLYRAGDDR